MTQPKAEVAYHEAGHAVAHFAFDIPFDKVTIVPDSNEGILGAVHHSLVTDPYGWDGEEDEVNLQIDKYVMINFAGSCAQERYSGTFDTDGFGDGTSGDFESVIQFASRRCRSDDEKEAYLKWLQIRTRNLVIDPGRWLQIEAVALALLEKETLNYDEAIDVMIKAVKTWEAQYSQLHILQPTFNQ